MTEFGSPDDAPAPRELVTPASRGAPMNQRNLVARWILSFACSTLLACNGGSGDGGTGTGGAGQTGGSNGSGGASATGGTGSGTGGSSATGGTSGATGG